MNLINLLSPTVRQITTLLVLCLTTSSFTFACPDFCSCHDSYVTCTDFKSLDLIFLPPAADTLVISMGEMEVVPPAFFARASNLKVVEIINFNARVVRGGAFRGLNNLELLSITQSSFDIVEPDAFSGLNFISSIQISDCHFGRVGKHAFAEITNVDEWRIWASYFTSISDEAFYGLRDIHTLQIYQNNISYIGHNIFAKSENMDYINFYMNYIKTLSNGSLSRAMEVTERLVVYANTFECTCDIAWMQDEEDFRMYLTTNECVFPGSLKVMESTFRLSDVSMKVLCPLATPPTVPTQPTTPTLIMHTMAPLFVEEEVGEWSGTGLIEGIDANSYSEVPGEEGKLSAQNATHENASAMSDDLSFHSTSSSLTISSQSPPLPHATEASSVVVSTSSLSPSTLSKSFVSLSSSSVDTHVDTVVETSLDKTLTLLSTELEIEKASLPPKSEHPSSYLDQTTISLISPMVDVTSENLELFTKRVVSSVHPTFDDNEKYSPDFQSSSLSPNESTQPPSPPPSSQAASAAQATQTKSYISPSLMFSSSSTLQPPLPPPTPSSSLPSSLSPLPSSSLAQTSESSQELLSPSSPPPQPSSSIPPQTSLSETNAPPLSSSPMYLSDQSEQFPPDSPTLYNSIVSDQNSPSQYFTDKPSFSKDDASHFTSFSPSRSPTAKKNERKSDIFTITTPFDPAPSSSFTDKVATGHSFGMETTTTQQVEESSFKAMPAKSVSDSSVQLIFEIQASQKSASSSLSKSLSDSSTSSSSSLSPLSSTSSSILISTLISSSESDSSSPSISFFAQSKEKSSSDDLLSEIPSSSDSSVTTEPGSNSKSPVSESVKSEQTEYGMDNTEVISGQEVATARLAPVISQTKKHQMYAQAIGMETTTQANDSVVSSKAKSVLITCTVLLSLWITTICR